MTKENLDEVIGTFSDGELTKGKFRELMHKIKTNEDYLDNKTYNSLFQKATDEGMKVLTIYEFVRCREHAIFISTGVTRD